MKLRRRRALRALLDTAAVVAAVVFVASYFPAPLMFSPTTTNGGDMGSHYYPVVYLRQVLLPRGQITGWCPGNYCGFPLFQLYFPLPFVLAAALSTAVPLPVAFKIVTVLGTFLLPPACYLGLRLLGTPFPGPALAALASLCFLFMEANSMWGGNIPSTLAGEFAFSLGLALAVVFVGMLRRAVRSGRGRAANGVLVATIGLTHGYPLLWAGFTSLAELVSTRRWWRRLATLVAIHGLALLLLGFWLVPLLAYAPWTTAYATVWRLSSWKQLLPPILWPAAAVAVGTAAVRGVLAALRREAFPRGLATIWWAVLVAVLFYAAASSFGLVDIRFVPFFQLGLCLAAAAGLGEVVSELPLPEVWPVVAGLAVFPFVQGHVTFIPSWIRWNYSGFERKAAWPTFRALNEHLRGDFRDPRVVYEHSPAHEALGTIRAFENLPLFSGRSTLEGLYMQGSPTAPFVFYIQSEISKAISCPFPQWGCARLDLDRGLAHLRMFNVSQFIVRSREVKAAAARHPGLEREVRIGAYEIYRVRGNDGRYAVPLALAPYVVRTRRWKEDAYRWFKVARPSDPVPVFVAPGEKVPESGFAGVYDGLPRQPPRRRLGPPPRLREHLEPERIVVTGCRPGHPVLVRVSYHPRWRSTGGGRVWLAGPSFMLVFPRAERLELVYDGGLPVSTGHALTGLGLVFLVLGLVAPVRRAAGRAWEALLGLAPVRPLSDSVRRTARWPSAVRRAVLGAALVVVGALFVAVALAARTTSAEALFRRGQEMERAGRIDAAVRCFRRAARMAPLSNTAVNATHYAAMALYRARRWREAERAFMHVVDYFPESRAAPEALYHVGLCRRQRGDLQGARAAWEQTRRRFPGTPWARYAGQMLGRTRSRQPRGTLG